MRVLIGVDDTDNLESRGTGYHIRQLAQSLARSLVAEPLGITRHQLLVDPRIPYTSHNSSACLSAEVSADALETLAAHCREFLARESADGSDAGLCIAPWEALTKDSGILEFGLKAQKEVLTKQQAKALADRLGILLEGLTGDHGGIIGALSAVGLRFGGNDGRYLWLRGLRELEGIHPVEALLKNTGIEEIRDLEGKSIPASAMINVGNWPRAVLRDGRAILLVEEEEGNDHHQWRVASKEFIKQY